MFSSTFVRHLILTPIKSFCEQQRTLQEKSCETSERESLRLIPLMRGRQKIMSVGKSMHLNCNCNWRYESNA